MSIFKGSGVAVVTPFNETGIDFDALAELIEWQIESGIKSIIVSGTTGEAPTLTYAEKEELFKETVRLVNGRVPVIAGTGTNNTRKAVELSQLAEKFGVDGLLVVSPYYNKCSQNGLILHFNAIADSVNIPIILYNVPSRTGLNIEPETIKTLSKHKNICGIKEASGDISQIVEVSSLINEDFAMYSGNDDQVLPLLSLGGLGVISTIANIAPKESQDLCDAYFDGDFNRARDLQFSQLELIKALFSEVNPIPVKTALNLMGKKAGILRLPLCPMQVDTESALRTAMTGYGLLELGDK